MENSEVVGHPKAKSRKRTSRIDECNSHHFPCQMGQRNALAFLVDEGEVRHSLTDLQRWLSSRRGTGRSLENLQLSRCHWFLRRVFVGVNANVLGVSRVLPHGQLEVDNHPGF